MNSPPISFLPDRLRSNPSVAELPVVEVLPELAAALEKEKKALVQAPPGAGKTTLVPLALLDQSWLKDKKIVMLEPRRLAARACAGHMAGLLGEKPGQTVGYQVRLDRCIGPRTRIEIITEGILTRRIQADPGLEDVGLLIFDEFHERHIHGDLGLALSLESAEVFNPDLRILVMSATMDMDALSAIMGNAPMIFSEGRTWPVTTRYLPPVSRDQVSGGYIGGRSGDKGREILPACFRAVQKALDEEEGDILVFLPGAAQIRAMADRLGEAIDKASRFDIYPLFGNLSPREQAAAIAPSRPGRRKIVLATPIAETSLTIQGVRVVVDSGLARAPRFSPGRGMTRLETLPVSRASADQRQGRAGRTAPGVCYRLWSEHVHQGLIPFNRPEILSADLMPLVLELAQWGVADPRDLKWLDVPPESAFKPAAALLKLLGALDKEGMITAYGRKLLSAGVHPRLAHMVIRARALGQGFMGCCLAAMAEERDFIFIDRGGGDPDVGLRLEILAGLARGKTIRKQVNLKAAKNILTQARNLAARFKVNSNTMDISMAGRILAVAWPGRIAKKRKADSLSYLMASGSGAFFRFPNTLSGHEYIVAIHLDGHLKNANVFLAAAYDRADLEEDFSEQVEIKEEVAWDVRTRSVRAFTRTWYGKLMLRQTPLVKPDPSDVQTALLQGIEQTGLDILPWTKALQQFRHRVIFLRDHSDLDRGFADLPDLSNLALTASLEDWLAPFLNQITSAAGLRQVDLGSALKHLLSWDQQQLIDAHAPTHVIVPSGSKIPISYSDDNGPLEFPVLAVRLQEMFGLMATPAVARGKFPLTLHLLSPAGRPVQITRDLGNFWNHTYAEVKKDLMGRYPKHYWPDDPSSAMPTKRVKPRKR